MSAYGKTQDEAIDNFKRHFNTAIQAYREGGKLEGVLTRSGIEWWWEGEYPQDRPAYEDTDTVPAPSADIRDGRAAGQQYTGTEELSAERVVAFAA